MKRGPKTFIAGLLLVAGFFLISAQVASAETRTLKLYFIHTKERAEITYKRNGRYLQSGLNEINQFLRDWRRNEPTKMDPRLLDLVWEVYQAAGARDYIHVVSAYRSPKTNAMLRSRSSGVAEKSQHMLGKAMDFYIPGVKLSTLRAIALKKQVGGVGYYPRSGSPFVHLDVGGVRHWPRMSRKELAAIFPDGKTLHVPSDGKPMPGYQQAVAAYEARKKNGGSIQVADDSRGNRGRGLLAALFGGGADEEEDNADMQVAAAPRPERTVQVAARQQQAQQPRAAPEPQPEAPGTLIAALPAREVPVPRTAPRPDVNVGTSLLVASATPADQGQAPLAAAPEQPEQEPQAADVMAALNVPLPSRRPDYTPPEAAMQVAEAAEPGETALATVAYVTPTRRPEPPASADAIAALLAAEKDLPANPQEDEQPTVAAYLPVPDSRPHTVGAGMAAATGNGQSSAEMARQVISKADALATSASAAATPAVVAALREEGTKEEAWSPGASPRMAMLENKGRANPFAGVKTTPKGPRPSPDDAAKAPAPHVMPVRALVADIALSRESMLNKSAVARVPAFSSEMAEAPTAVYTDGFKQGDSTPDARRFTGKAVTFLSLAKFE
ncbi:DUF882 domain-containing protein [Chelativorans sp. AA-79]|uniref:DUF882 domain-containing protein n=1 Tax=Chelativorans sp. AA-79 TaxID=3028735 RepID=UPI0023F713EE|nr:DUF882 domain-containing protein [Chelativorans sp. AA-79]WEX10369.1 DUF882 domain-containing protein [Chelativorans sp. AA-79]